jgi:hypothetical protein
MRNRVNRWATLMLASALMAFLGCGPKSTGGPGKTAMQKAKADASTKSGSNTGPVTDSKAPSELPATSVWATNKKSVINIAERAGDSCATMVNASIAPEGENEEEAVKRRKSISRARTTLFASVNEIADLDEKIKSAIKEEVKPGITTVVKLTNYHIIADNRSVKRALGILLNRVYKETKAYDSVAVAKGNAGAARLAAADGELELRGFVERIKQATATTWHREPIPDIPTEIPVPTPPADAPADGESK